MEHQDNFFGDDITTKNSSVKIDDLTSLKNASLDFLSMERNEKFDAIEKFDAEKPKEKEDVDDFLNFHDDVGESQPPQVPSIEEKFQNDESEDETNVNQPEAEIDFHALEDDYLNPYASSNLAKPANDKFISSEDLLSDFKDPAPIEPAETIEPAVETFVDPPIPERVEPPKPVAFEAVEKQPPVSAPVVVEQPKPQPSPTPAKPQTSADIQIEAEKIFTSIGLG